MRQWELYRVTDRSEPLVAGRERRERGEAKILRERSLPERFPMVLWTTDVCLGFTSSPPPGTLSLDVPLDPSDGDLFDLFAADDDGAPIVEAHLSAVRGGSAEFTLRDRDRVLRCLVSALPNDEGRTIGTLCIALGVLAEVATPPPESDARVVDRGLPDEARVELG